MCRSNIRSLERRLNQTIVALEDAKTKKAMHCERSHWERFWESGEDAKENEKICTSSINKIQRLEAEARHLRIELEKCRKEQEERLGIIRV